LKKYLRDYLFLFSISGLVIFLDQWSKHLVRSQIELGSSWAPWEWLYPYARFVHLTNTGAAFGTFQGMSGVFTILAIIVSGVIIYYFPRVPRQDWLLRLALSLQLGGAVGNLIDRIRYGTVTDFVSVGSFAIFNVADSCITIGTVLLALDLLIKEYQERKAKQLKASSTPQDTKEEG
jgi:signal peptidase II